MTIRLIWWQAYKAAVAAGRSDPRIAAGQAVADYTAFIKTPGINKVLS